MKRLIAIPLLFLYMVATSGIIVHLHYCGEQIESWALNNKAGGCEDDPCDENDSKEHSCCKDKVVKGKISWEQSLASQFNLSLSQKHILPDYTTCFVCSTDVIPVTDQVKAYFANAPPGNWQSIPLYKLHSRLTYYG